MSEFGAGALQGNHGNEIDRWTEEYQDAVSRRVVGELSSNEFKVIERAIGQRLKDSDLPDNTKEAIRIFLFLQFQSLGVS